MVEPITTALIAGALSTGINAFTAWKKGNISEDQYRQAVNAAKQLENKLRTLRPDETWQDINPELFKEAAKFSPDIATFVQENAPEIIKEAGSAEQKQIQRQALQKYAAQAETGRDVIAEAQREQALFEADARAKQRQQALMERMKQQGMLGSGAALAAQLQTEQAERQAAREQSLRGVQEAELRRRQALGEAAQLAGQMRQTALNVESANVETMNAYNQRLANAKNIYNRYSSNLRNEAQLENQRRQAAVEQANIELRNRYGLMNKQQRRAAAERSREFDVNLANRMFDLRQGAEGRRQQAEAEKFGDYATAITSGIGTGLSTYGAATAAKKAGAQAEFWKSLGQSVLQGAAQGTAQGAAQRAVSRPVPEPRYSLGVDYGPQVEDVSSESFDLTPSPAQQSASGSQYSRRSPVASRTDTITMAQPVDEDVDEQGRPIRSWMSRR